MSDITNGLFKVICNCGNVFAAEDGKCSCGKARGELKFDIEKMLNRLYDLSTGGKVDEALDLVFSSFWNLATMYDVMNDILAQVDVSKLEPSILIGVLTQTFKYDKQIPNHIVFFNKVADRMKELRETEEEVKAALKGLEGSGNYWEDMKALGAGWRISGPRPPEE